MNCSIFALMAIVALLLCATVQAVDKSACSLPKDSGPCRGAEPKYYYDSKANACKHFFYGSCQGNDNRFDKKEDCEKLCLNK